MFHSHGTGDSCDLGVKQNRLHHTSSDETLTSPFSAVSFSLKSVSMSSATEGQSHGAIEGFPGNLDDIFVDDDGICTSDTEIEPRHQFWQQPTEEQQEQQTMNKEFDEQQNRMNDTLSQLKMLQEIFEAEHSAPEQMQNPAAPIARNDARDRMSDKLASNYMIVRGKETPQQQHGSTFVKGTTRINSISGENWNATASPQPLRNSSSSIAVSQQKPPHSSSPTAAFSSTTDPELADEMATVAVMSEKIVELAKRSDNVKLKKLLDDMSARRISPNKEARLRFYGACEQAILILAKRQSVSMAERIMNLLMSAGSIPSLQCFQAIIRTCSLVRAADKAEKWFESQREHGHPVTVIEYNHLISAGLDLLPQASLERAEHWMRRMPAENVQPDALSYNAMIQACYHSKDINKAEMWIEEMQSQGFRPKSTVIDALISHTIKSGDVAKADLWLSKSIRLDLSPSVGIFALVIRAQVQSGDLSKADMWFEYLRRADVDRLWPDKMCYSVMVSAYAKANNIKKAGECLNEMVEAGLTPNIIGFTSLIHACAKTGQAEEAEYWLQRMGDLGVVPDEVCYNSVIHASARAGNLSRAEFWLYELVAAGFSPHEISFNTIIGACAGVGDYEKAEFWLNQMKELGLQPNTITYNSLLNACAQAKNSNRAVAHFLAMLEEGLVPDIVTYGTLCKTYSMQGDYQRVQTLIARAEGENMTLNEHFFRCLLVACEKAQPMQPAHAEQAIRAMVSRGLNVKRSDIQILQECIGAGRTRILLRELKVPLDNSNKDQRSKGQQKDGKNRDTGKGKGKGKADGKMQR